MRSKLSRTHIILIVAFCVLIMASASLAEPVEWPITDGGNGHFYDVILVGTPLSWDDARSAAQAIGSNWDLVTITSSAENDFVKGLFANDPSFFNMFAFSGVRNRSGPWIGAYNVFGSTNFQWVTGEPVTYTNWGPSEPFGNGQTVSYTDFSSPFGDGIGIAWNDIGPDLRTDGPIAYIVEASINPTLSYTPVTPCRIVDTRKAGGIIGTSTQRDFSVYGSGPTISAQGGNAGGCSSPGGVPYAAHINMIAVNPIGKGNLQAFPVGAGTGAGLSVNYNTIDTNLANAGTVKTVTGSGPDISVASNFSSAHTVIDVLGYYYPDEGLYYTPVDPCRIVDTRKTTAGIINANTDRDFRVYGPVADQGGDPSGCPSTLGVSPEAAHLNMVAVNPTGKGNLQAFPAGAGVGAGLSVNYNTIDTNLADAGTVKTSPDITVASNFSSAHTVIDVLGYYSEEEDLLYTPVNPCRIVDTRKTTAGIINANTQRDFRVFGSVTAQGGNSSGCSAPMGEPLAAHINMVAVNPTGKGNLQAFPVGAGTGAGLSVNYNTIDTNLANAGTVKTVTGSGPDITVASNFSSAHTVIDVLGYYYPAP